MISIQKNPPAKVLSQFGIIWLPAMLLVLVVFLTSRLESSLWTILLCILAAVSMTVGLWRPMLLKAPFIGLQYLTWPIGFIVSYLLLAVIYYVLITPLGMLMRLVGYDPLRRRMPFGSLWHVRQPVIEQGSYFRQF